MDIDNVQSLPLHPEPSHATTHTQSLPRRAPSPFNFDNFCTATPSASLNRPPSPFDFGNFLGVTDGGTPPSAEFNQVQEVEDDSQVLRASPDRDADLTEEERKDYALAIWHARYNGNWVAPVFPPTFINAPDIILRDICEKTIRKDEMTFAIFDEYLKYPEFYPEVYHYKVCSLIIWRLLSRISLLAPGPCVGKRIRCGSKSRS